MGTHATIQILGRRSEKDIVLSYIKNGFKEMKRIENLLSHYYFKSEVFILNRDGFLDKPSADLLFLLGKSKYFFTLSNGLFDVTIQPLLESPNRNINLSTKLSEMQNIIGFNNVVFDQSKVVFKKRGMKITLGGIAKGYAVDRVIEFLKNMEVKNALVDIGGDIKALSDEHTWTVGVRNPFRKEEIITKVKIGNQAIATSGNYERLHILRPDGLSIEVASATVITKNAVDADALATIGVLMGKEFLHLAENLPNTEALLVMNGGEILRTSGFSCFEQHP
jgi:thiamine biosynthesis lipoprotein